jgi:hypothetical protein
MTLRYGIFIAPQPEFTARAYQARQIICGQYGTWAAEMLMVHITLAEYFPCSGENLDALGLGLKNLAAQSRREHPQIPLRRRGVATDTDSPGTIFLDFGPIEADAPLNILYRNVIGLVKDLSSSETAPSANAGEFRPRLPLMQYANLPPAVFSNAEEFASKVVEDIGVPETTIAWSMTLARFHSQAAEENWEAGSWATDISWELLSSYPL